MRGTVSIPEPPLRLPLLLLLLSLLPRAAPAMEFLSSRLSDDETVIRASGPIRLGDEARFLEVTRGFGERLYLLLDSPGGNVAAANSMRALVHGLGIRVLIPADAECASACFLLFVAARERVVERGARVGVHSASRAGREEQGSLAATTIAARIAADYGVPPTVVARMVTTPPGDMWWLPEADLGAIPNTRIVEASLAPPRPAPRPSAPPAAAVAAPAATATLPGKLPGPAAASGAFAQGRADWAATETWLFSTAGGTRAGAESWIRRRSLRTPGGCDHADPDFARGCFEARARFGPIDARRTADPEYRRGFSPR